MGDRTDLDALLIGALYGELTPADEARLAAHLESHPADRSALADLAHTRDAVRASRVFAIQFDPPQQVSALLLQEAARRLPSKDPEAGGWFYRFTRLVLGNPTMAVVGAAAMFVLVIGVAGTLYVKGVPQYAEHAAPAAVAPSEGDTVASAPSASAPSPSAPSAGAPSAGAAAPDSPAAASTAADLSSTAPLPAVVATPPTARPAGTADGLVEFRHADAVAGPKHAPAPATKPDSFRVGLEEGQLAVRQRTQDQGEAAKAGNDKRAKAEVVAADSEVERPEPKLKKQAGIVVRTPEAKPKELSKEMDDDSAAARQLSDLSAQRRDEPRGQRADASNKVARGGAGGGFAVPPTGDAAGAPPQNQAPASESVAASGRAAAPRATAPASPAAPPPARPAPTQVTSQSRYDGKTDQAKDARPSDENAGKVAEDTVLAAWARKQHDQVKALVKSNNCLGAANVAVGIYGRAPDYYTANVATDRELKTCMAYLNRERDREDRNRAAKRALSNEPAASATKK